MSKETKDVATEVINNAYHLAIDHAIQTVQSHLPNIENAQGTAVDALEYELNLIISELKLLKK